MYRGGAQVKKRTLKIWQMKNKGMKTKDIADELGLTMGNVGAAIQRGIKKGEVKKRTQQSMLGQHHRYGIKRGTIGEIIKGLTIEQQDWIAVQTLNLKCHSVSEYILEIVRDTYEEENQK